MFNLTARGASIADFIQPSLGPLQPNLEDFMDTLEPLQGKTIFHRFRKRLSIRICSIAMIFLSS